MGRHAYLIMCHNNFDILEKLVSLLDDPANDLYIHIDRKVPQISKIKRRLVARNATVTFTKRISVSWGGFSQVRAELLLLKAATKREHDYYHLLSGVDMPLKSQKDIHDFFRQNQGKEFISFDPDVNDEVYESRIRYYRFFQDIIGRRTDMFASLLRSVEVLSLRLQFRLGTDRRSKDSKPMGKGSNWFSVTHGLAMYLLQNEKEIARIYRYGLGVDELFLQTIALSSPYAGNIVNDGLRHIDWKRGSPYVFKAEDYNELIGSPKLFARKFDEKVDMAVVERLYNRLQADDAI